MRDLRLAFPPGSRYSYSNDGYFLLGAIIATVVGSGNGQDYYDYLHRQIFEAAGMRDSGFLTRSERLANRRFAHPYELGESGKRVDALPAQGFAGHPGGNSVATAPDMAKFARSLLDGTLMDPVHRDIAFSPKLPSTRTPSPNAFVTYASGLELIDGRRSMGAGGMGRGICTSFTFLPDLEWSVVVLGNYDEIPVRDLTNRVARIIVEEAAR